MKITILSDTHGRSFWKHIVQKENDSDVFIWLGDYFDSFDIPGVEQIYNFKQIIQFKETSEAEVIMLIGNHDVSYLPGFDGWNTSGYQAGIAPSIQQLLEENKHHLQMAYQMGSFLFSHAGLSESWLEYNKWDGELDVCEFVNMMWQYKPLSFKFNGRDPYGDDVYQTPIWIRPKSLMKDCLNFKKKYIQVVGHTVQNCIDIKGKSTGGRYYFTDVLGTSQEYLIIEDWEVKLGKI